MKKVAKEWRFWVLGIALIFSTVMLVPWDNPTLFFDQTGDDITIQTTLENRTSIEFRGGTRMLLDLESNATGTELEQQATQVKNTLEIRLSNLDIADPSVRVVDIGNENYKVQIEVGGTNQTRLRQIISQEGQFEARMPVNVYETKNWTLGPESYAFTKNGNEVTVEHSNGTVIDTYVPGDRFILPNGLENYDTEFVYLNSSEEVSNIEVVAYSGDDIQDVVKSDSTVRGGGPYNFNFPVVISTESARNVRIISENYETRLNSDYLMLENGEFAELGMYVDGNQETSLRMAAAFQRQVITQPSIQGGAETRAGAQEEMQRLQAILESGSLPVPVSIGSISTLSSSLGSEFMAAAITSIIASLVAVGVLVYIRYRDPRLAIPIVLTGASEVYILLGGYFTTAGTLSLSAVAGIIAAVGTGVDDQIIITDESGREELEGWKKKMKRAFFVIFTSAASTIGAMAPILAPSLVSLLIGAAGVGLIGYTWMSKTRSRHFIAIGVLATVVSVATSSLGPSGAALSTIHEFALTTIIGILIGITITRPAYAKTVEYIKN